MTLQLPKAKVTVKDGGLGIIASPAEGIHVVMGCAQDAPANTNLKPFQVTTLDRLKSDYKAGPAVRAAAYSIGKTAAEVVFVRLPASVRAAQVKDVTVPAGKTVTFSGTPNDGYDIVIECTADGTIGSAPGPTLKWSKDGGENFTTPAALGGGTTLVLTGTGLTANFTATQAYTAGLEITAWTIPAAASTGPVTATRANSGSPSTSVVTLTGSAVDDYEIVFEPLAGGTIGTTGISFRYSLDGGRSWSKTLALGTATSVELLDGEVSSGVTVNLAAGTLDTLDRFTALAFAPAFSAADALTALTNLEESTLSWRFVHFAGWLGISDVGSLNTKLESLSTGQSVMHRYGAISARPRGTYEVESLWESRLLTDVAVFEANRMGIAAAHERITCPMTGRRNRRSVLWATMARLVSKTPQVDPGRKLDGSLGSDVSLHDDNGQRVEHDARVSSVLHGARYITHRTYARKTGVYVTRGNLMSAETSDFNRIAYRAVMDIAAEIFNDAMQEQLENHFATNPAVGGPSGATVGAIRETDARRLDREITFALDLAVTQKGYAVGVQVRVSRTDPFLSTGKLTAKVSIFPLGYLDSFEGEISFVGAKLAGFQTA
jgi:hypothetical protein